MRNFLLFGAQPGSVTTPAWVRDAVFYQIFPDRFAKSAFLTKPAGLEDWNTEPTTYGYKGGDLLGVVEHLDYIQDLGVNAIYLNPIFQSASNHRYHTHDYMQVDPLLGGNAAFRTFMDACHERNIRVVLDGVFNHASRGFLQFNDILENGQGSPWRDWFRIDSYPPNAYDHSRPPGYDAWVGLHALPNFNTDNPEVREFLMGVGEYWIRQGIDGWRLDVPFEIRTPGFWQEFRTRIKAIDPDAYLVGEIWNDSREWLQGDQFDGVMNYLFTESVIAFAGQHHVVENAGEQRSYHPWPGIDAPTYAAKIERLLGLYDWNVQVSQMNLLDSHDTARALTLFGGDRRSLELAVLLLLSFPGAPSIYYGDEIGVDGGLPDRWARKPFPWDDHDEWDHELLNIYKRLIEVRQAQRTLRDGTYQTLHAQGGLYVAARTHAEGNVLVVVNAGEFTAEWAIPSHMRVDGSAIVVIGESPRITGASACIPARAGCLLAIGRDA